MMTDAAKTLVSGIFTVTKAIVDAKPTQTNHHRQSEVINNISQALQCSGFHGNICVQGFYGNGKTTVIQDVKTALSENQPQGTIVYLDLRWGVVSKLSLWTVLDAVSKKLPDAVGHGVLTKASASEEEKENLAVSILQKVSVVIIDHADHSTVTRDALQALCEKAGCKTLTITASLVPSSFTYSLSSYLTEEDCVVEIRHLKLDDHEECLKAICLKLQLNPLSVNILLNVAGSLGLEDKNNFLLQLQDSEFQEPVFKVLNVALSFLRQDEKEILQELCDLRQPLPVQTNPVWNKLKLFQLINSVEDEASTYLLVSLPYSVQAYLTDNPVVLGQSGTRKVLECWLSLMSDKLQSLVSEAQGHQWPFVPEEWQYAPVVGEEQRVNTRELLSAPNHKIPWLTEKDILLECLHHSLCLGEFQMAAALIFLLDRFMYWAGASKDLLKIVKFIEDHSLEASIAPQVVIRKARVLKDSGALQAADSLLGTILDEEKERLRWGYKDDSQYLVVRSTCAQIKGVIKHNLGLWNSAASLLFESIVGYNSLTPQPDKKGISSSLGILAETLRNIPAPDFLQLKQSFSLSGQHPVLEGYHATKEAAWLARFNGLFLARGLRRAGELLMQYFLQANSGVEQRQMLDQAIEEMKLSLQAHEDINSLNSREQMFEFIAALFQIVCALRCSRWRTDSLEQSGKLEVFCQNLFQKFCSGLTQMSSKLDDNTAAEVNSVMALLDLAELPQKRTNKLSNLTIQSPGYHYPSTLQGHQQYYYGPREFTPVMPGLVTYFVYAGIPVYQNTDGSGSSESGYTSEATSRSGTEDSVGATVDPNATTVNSTADSEGMSQLEGRLEHVVLSQRSADVGNTVDPDATTVNSTCDPVQNMRVCDAQAPVDLSGQTVDPNASTVNSTQDLQQASGRPGSDPVASSLPGFSPGTTLPGTREFSSLPIDRNGYQSFQQRRDVPSGILKAPNVQNACLWRYDPQTFSWSVQASLAYLGEPLQLAKGKEGAQRDVQWVQYLGQEEPLGRYVGKQYKRERSTEQYQQDIVCQMTSYHYAAAFNVLTSPFPDIRQIQFVPVIYLQLLAPDGSLTGCMNVEPFMEGNFIKLTNNFDYCNILEDGLATAFSHFTWVASEGKIMVVDLQGWLPVEGSSFVVLTDPQIHSEVYQCYGAANLGEEGIKIFWDKVHPKCNDVCRRLHLKRPES